MLPGGRRWRAGHQGEGAQGGAIGRRHTSQAPRVCSPSLRADLTASTHCSSAKDPAHHAEVQEVPDHVSGILSSNLSAVSLSTSCTLPSGRVLAGPSVEVEVMMGICRAALLLCIKAGRFGAVELSLPEALSTAFLPRGEQHLLLGLMLHGKSSSSNLSEARRMLSPPALSRAGAQYSPLCMLTHGADTEQKRGSVPALYAATPMNAPGARCALPEALFWRGWMRGSKGQGWTWPQCPRVVLVLGESISGQNSPIPCVCCTWGIAALLLHAKLRQGAWGGLFPLLMVV